MAQSSHGIGSVERAAPCAQISLHLGLFDRCTPIDRMIAETARAGFDAVEPAMTPDGPLTFTVCEADCARVAKHAREAGLEVSAVAVGSLPEVHLASSDAARRGTAYEHVVAALDRARWLGTGAVVLAPAVVGGPASPHAADRCEDAHSLALEALLALRFEAEQRAVRLACATCASAFLLSPPEMRGFLDQINSPWVGACLELPRAAQWATPRDWITTLGYRIVRVRFSDVVPRDGPEGGRSLGEPDMDWSAVMAQLRKVRYRGPVTVHGHGRSAEIAARLADAD